MTKIKNVLSLFDGMSVGRYALEKAGIEFDNYYASEIDKYAIQIAQKNYPSTIQLGNILDLDIEKLKNMDIDLIIGGSPCQGFSFAGKQKGASTIDNIEITTLEQYLKLKKDGFEFQGESYLFWEYIRILDAVKPKYFLLENVRMSDKWEKVITKAIGVEPIKINSNLVSAQDRIRLYWTNITGITQPEDRNIFLKDIWAGGRDITDRIYSKIKGTLSYKKAWSNVRTLNQKSKTLTAGGQNISNSGATNVKIGDRYFAITPLEAERLQTLPDNYTDGVSNTQRLRMLGNGWTAEVIIHILKQLK